MQILKKEELLDIETESITDEFAGEMIKVGEEMISLCVENGGIGLAGPQVGINKKIFVWMNTDETFQIVFNPTYYPDGKKTHVVESCLSFPGENYYLTRFKEIRAVYYTFDGTKLIKITKHLIGMRAYIFQHEVDHLNGITMADRGQLIEA